MNLMFDPEQFELADLHDHGLALLKSNRFDEALQLFNRLLYLKPDDKYARWNRVLCWLSLGDYANGFAEHDCAWDVFNWRRLGPVEGNIDRLWNVPVWQGERCRRLLVYHEMGFGDAVMLLRFLPEIVKLCESVTLVVSSELVSLMRGYGATVIDHVPQDVSGFDARITLFNSMAALGHTLRTIPSEPYVKVKFDRRPGTMAVTWSGNSQTEFNCERLVQRLDVEGYELYTFGPDDLPGVRALHSKDFRQTAELMATMDTIVTVDTSVAHVAGAIGHPNAHLLLPYFRDWRWWAKDRWYPTLNIYPQDRPKDWSAPFARLNRVLKCGRPARC